MAATLTTVLARGTPTSQRVLEIMRQWAAADLVKPFLWVDMDEVDLETPFAPLIAHRVARAEDGAQDLLGYFAQGILDSIRVVVLETIGGSDEYSAEFLQRCHELVDRVGPVLPVSIGTNGAPLTRLDSCRLVMPTSEAATSPLSTMDLAWTRTVVVSPEFRASPDSVPEYVRGDNLAPHAAAHVAAIGGLWEGMDGGVLDEDLSSSSSTGYQTVLVSRAFARIIRTDGMAEALAAEVAKVANGDAPVPFGVETGTVRAQDDERLVALAVGVLNEDGQFDFSIDEPDAHLQKRTAGWRETLIHVLRFLVSCLGLLVTVPLSLLVDAAERGTTALTYGTGGTTQVKFRPKDERVLQSGAKQLLNDKLDDILAKVRRAEMERQSAPTPSLWQRLRDLSFGLIDGALPADVKFPQSPDGRADVVRRRGSVVAPPFPSSVPCAGTVELLGDDGFIVRKGAESAVDVALVLTAAAVAEQRIRVLSDGEPRVTTTSVTSDNDDESGATADEAVPEEELPVAIRQRITECTDISLLEALVADADRVRQHEKEVIAPSTRRSLHARLMASIDAASDRAQAALDAVTLPIDWTSLKPHGVDRQRRIFLAGSYLGIAAWISVAVYTISAGRQRFSWEWVLDVVVFRGLVGLALLMLVLGLLYFQAVSGFNRRVELTLHRLVLDGDRAEAVVHERARLQNVAIQLRDWSSVIGRVIHEPVALPALTPEVNGDSSAELARELPAGVSVTVRPQIAPTRRQLEELLGKEIGRGWLSRTFHELVGQAAYIVERPGPELLADADNDVPSAPNGARTELLNRLRSGSPQHEAAQALLTRASTVAMARGGAGDASGRDTDYLDAIVGQPTAFVQYPFTPGGLVAKSFEPKRSITWAPIGTRGATDTQEVRVIDRVVMAGRSYDMSIRCDVSGELDPRHLHLFDQSAVSTRVALTEERDRF